MYSNSRLLRAELVDFRSSDCCLRMTYTNVGIEFLSLAVHKNHNSINRPIHINDYMSNICVENYRYNNNL